ncbi:MAG: FoF1 ATP synthase subunit gamma [Evtepia sp.]
MTYVPSQEQVLNHLVPGYVQGILFGTLVESFCAEQNARMTAMDSSSTNAREMLKDLSLRYNRARQAAIIPGDYRDRRRGPAEKTTTAAAPPS